MQESFAAFRFPRNRSLWTGGPVAAVALLAEIDQVNDLDRVFQRD